MCFSALDASRWRGMAKQGESPLKPFELLFRYPWGQPAFQAATVPSPSAKRSTPQPVMESLGRPRMGGDFLGLCLYRFISGLVAGAPQLCQEFMKAPSSLFSPISPPCFSLLGVGVLTLFGVHHLVRVMPGRKSSRSGRPRGRAFGKGSERSGEEKRG